MRCSLSVHNYGNFAHGPGVGAGVVMELFFFLREVFVVGTTYCSIFYHKKLQKQLDKVWEHERQASASEYVLVNTNKQITNNQQGTNKIVIDQ